MIHKLDLNMYPLTIYIGYNSCIEDITELFKDDFDFYKEFEDRIDSNSIGCTYKVNTKINTAAIFIHIPKRSKRDVGTWAHEAFHASAYIYEYIDEEITDSEPFAYLIGYIVKNIENVIKNKNE